MKQTPHNLSEITLYQWVGYQNKYGQALDDRLAEISAMKSGPDRLDAILLHDVDLYTQNYAYWTETPLDEVVALGISEVIKLQCDAFIQHKRQALKLNYFEVFDFAGDKWKVQPIYRNTGNLTKAEYDMSVDVALIFSDLQDGKHEAMYDLCAMYLRKLEEPYHSDLIEQRRELMKSLPLNIALTVRKFVIEAIDKIVKK